MLSTPLEGCQLARNIDVMLEQNPLLEPPLRQRDPDKNLFVFQSPAMFQRESACSALRVVVAGLQERRCDCP